MRTLTWVNKVLADNDTLLCGAESAVLGTRDLEIAKERTMRFRYIRRKASNASYLRIRRAKKKRGRKGTRVLMAPVTAMTLSSPKFSDFSIVTNVSLGSSASLSESSSSTLSQ